MTVREFYESISGDYDQAMERLMSENLVLQFVLEFEDHSSFEALSNYLFTNQMENALYSANNLAGVCSYLSFTPLAESASELAELLNSGRYDEAFVYFNLVKVNYEAVLDSLRDIA